MLDLLVCAESGSLLSIYLSLPISTYRALLRPTAHSLVLRGKESVVSVRFLFTATRQAEPRMASSSPLFVLAYSHRAPSPSSPSCLWKEAGRDYPILPSPVFVSSSKCERARESALVIFLFRSKDSMFLWAGFAFFVVVFAVVAFCRHPPVP